jgi:hypothetical protein
MGQLLSVSDADPFRRSGIRCSAASLYTILTWPSAAAFLPGPAVDKDGTPTLSRGSLNDAIIPGTWLDLAEIMGWALPDLD